MKFSLFFTTLIFNSSLVFASNMDVWTKNYSTLVSSLQKTTGVGECSISLSTDPNSPKGSVIVNFLRNPGGLSSFDLVPPTITKGETRVVRLQNGVLRYSQADMVGWVNLIVTFNQSEKIIAIELNKSFSDNPDGSIGTVYDQGLICKD